MPPAIARTMDAPVVRWWARDPAPGEGGDRTVFTADPRPLFGEALPSGRDVVQGAIGDCYFLAALRAVLATPGGPAWVRGMVRDEGDRVVVRLFKPVPSTASVATTAPVLHEIGVERTVPRARGRGPRYELVNPDSALWVVMAEKAYASFRLGAPLVRMSELRTGDTDVALGHILGKPVTRHRYAEPGDPGGPLVALLRPILGEPKWCEHARKPLPVTREQGADRVRVFGFAVWMEYVKWIDRATAAAWGEFVRRFTPEGPSEVAFASETMRLGDVETFLAARACPARTRAVILDHVRASGLLAGKRGTGAYTLQQLERFALVRDALSSGKAVSAGTKPFVGHERGADRREPGGNIVKGLVAGHAYAVTGAEHDERSGLRFVRVQDPYGFYGRTYGRSSPTGPLRARAHRGPHPLVPGGDRHEMALELGDFCKRFGYVAVTDERVG